MSEDIKVEYNKTPKWTSHVYGGFVGIPGVLIIKFDFFHDCNIVPISKHYKWQSIVNISLKLGHFLREVLLFRINQQHCSILRCIKTCEGRAQHFHIVTTVAQMLVHILQYNNTDKGFCVCVCTCIYWIVVSFTVFTQMHDKFFPLKLGV